MSWANAHGLAQPIAREARIERVAFDEVMMAVHALRSGMLVGVVLTLLALSFDEYVGAAPSPGGDDAPATVSYYKDVLPILQANCHGCHQPAKAKGDYVMTSFDRMVAGVEGSLPGVVPGKPDESLIVEMITPLDGKADMPKQSDPLHATEIETIRRWIAQGAIDDTPSNARERYDLDHPPIYTRQPVITAIDHSPDGTLLAVAGFHEVLLVRADDGQLAARLIGTSQKIGSVRFSPDGSRLAVTGGQPGRLGEVQVWDVAKRELLVSRAVSYDTVFGASWSPDGKTIAFGCTDQSARAIDAATGEQVFFNAAHEDWVLDTHFSVDGRQLISVGRDMTAKLHEFAEERFIDNVTSVTPGALKGGILAVARHPQRDEIVIGGSDGTPKVYRMHRQTRRVIGDDANVIRVLPAMRGRVNSVAVSDDGAMIAAGSSLDGAGQVFIYAYDFDGTLPDDVKAIMSKQVDARSAAENERLEQYKTADITVLAQVQVKEAAIYAVSFAPDGGVLAAAGSDGLVRLIEPRTGRVVSSFAPAPIDAAAESIAQQTVTRNIDFIQDVNPVLSRLGCNAGTCHGSLNGKEGFKLSLRGYDAIFDVRALTDDHGSRRVNLASPDDSLMLLKATGAVAHGGGVLLEQNDPYYSIIRDWIAGGAKLNLDSPRVARIEVTPRNPVLAMPGDVQAMRVVATYADGTTRDVTREAFLESGNTEVARSDREARMTAIRRGEAPVLARYEGAYDATTVTVMGDRSGFVWRQPPTWGRIDELVAAKWQRMRIEPSGLCTDAEFIRRVTLDLTGLPPTADEVRAFLADERDTRIKRDELVDTLIGSEAFIEYWTNKWSDLLLVNSKFLGDDGAAAFRAWIRHEVASNTPYDQFARKIIAAEGSNKDNPAASYYKVLREPVDIMENTTHLFLGIRFNCNKCHDHPFERWTQDQYYETAAFFARVSLAADPASGDRKVGGTSVEKPKPYYEIVTDAAEGEVIHDRTQEIAQPRFPFDCDYEISESASRRDELAAWLTSTDNPYFARSYVNRLWGYMFGVGIIEPIDDIRAGNPPTNPPLLDYLEVRFIESGFDARQVLAEICKSRTYQLSFRANAWNEDDTINYSHAIPRRLPAEVIFDALHRVTGSLSHLPGVPAGTRAAELPDANAGLPSGFLDTFGRPARESACECERTNELQLGPVMALISGPTVADAIADPNNAIAKLVAGEPDDAKLIDELYLRILNRHATAEEVRATLDFAAQIDVDHAAILERLAQREAIVAPIRAEKQAARAAAIEEATVALRAYEAQIAPARAQMQQQRQARIAAAQAALDEYETTVDARFGQWLDETATEVRWHSVEVTAAQSEAGATLAVQGDGSILATGEQPGHDTRIVTARISIDRVTAVRLEALTDPSLPMGGPGQAPDGNFVLSRFSVLRDEPAGASALALAPPTATFSQKDYPVANSIVAEANDATGWAVSPRTGENHAAFYPLAQPLADARGATLTFRFEHKWRGQRFTLGRFRLSVTDAPPAAVRVAGEVGAEVMAALQTPAAERTDKHKADLLAHFRSIDAELQTLTQALAKANEPLPEDPQLVKLQAALAAASQPVPPDAQLAELQRIAAASEQQLVHKRLTMAQDLAWALINSPAFLFNH